MVVRRAKFAKKCQQSGIDLGRALLLDPVARPRQNGHGSKIGQTVREPRFMLTGIVAHGITLPDHEGGRNDNFLALQERSQ